MGWGDFTPIPLPVPSRNGRRTLSCAPLGNTSASVTTQGLMGMSALENSYSVTRGGISEVGVLGS